jgi:hypothetical protein
MEAGAKYGVIADAFSRANSAWAGEHYFVESLLWRVGNAFHTDAKPQTQAMSRCLTPGINMRDEYLDPIIMIGHGLSL